MLHDAHRDAHFPGTRLARTAPVMGIDEVGGGLRGLAFAHLALRMRPLQRALRALIARRDALAVPLREAGAVADVITRGHAEALLAQLASPAQLVWIGGHQTPTDDEVREEAELRASAGAATFRLPLVAVADELGLDAFETETLALCAAVELDSEYDRVLAYIHDDVARGGVSFELAAGLTANTAHEYLERRAALGPLGRLRRFGLIRIDQKAAVAREDLRPTPAALRTLLGHPADIRMSFRDPALVVAASSVETESGDYLLRVAKGLSSGAIEIVGIWGAPRAARRAVTSLAAQVGLEVRQLVLGNDPAAALADAVALGAVLWIDLDDLDGHLPRDLVSSCRASRAQLVLTGSTAWRPSELLADRTFVEIPIAELTADERRRVWLNGGHAFGDLELDAVSGFRFDPIEIRAAIRSARALAELRTNGHEVTPGQCIGEASAMVARKHGERHTTLIRPRRTARDLVLPAEVHARIEDVITYFRTNQRVLDDWGFGARVSGYGVKALFTGEPGTGKTLAAEVIAGEIGLPLLKVDLARVVSKWIGETEKNLELVFREAQDSHAVLLFDEAEALFGARGEVRHGTDRYANLEVSFLLQRLEDHAGVVILASNLRDKIDPAFYRRFHVVVGFPRPSEKERVRMWQNAFPQAAPVLDDVDIPVLSRLDLTGAGITSTAQIAASLAANDGSRISMAHVVRALVRQFHREARVFDTHALGAHAIHARAP